MGSVLVFGMVLSGCSALMGAGGFGGELPSSSPIAAYATGTATIAIKDGETINLDQVAKGSGVESLMGSDVRWTGSSGWHLRLMGAGGTEEFSPPNGFIAFDRIVDGQHWTSSFDGDRCIVDVASADKTSLRGSATCKGVAWYDALDVGFVQGPPKPLDEPKFDAEVTFEAVP